LLSIVENSLVLDLGLKSLQSLFNNNAPDLLLLFGVPGRIAERVGYRNRGDDPVGPDGKRYRNNGADMYYRKT